MPRFPGSGHTFHAYSKDWPKDHPEYFSLNAEGKRLRSENGSGPGQICLTNPETRRLVLENLRGFIKADRERLGKMGYPPPKIYDISHNDNHSPCLCPKCKALMEKEGAYSGVLIDFINEIADKIKPEYPDILVQTFAYTFTLEPPKSIKPHDNVMIRVCNLGVEFPGDGISEPTRPMTDPANAKFKSYLKRWSETSSNIAIWDYWRIYTKPFAYPYLDMDKVCGALKDFRDFKAKSVYVENEVLSPTSFYPLKRWLSLKLMDNPDANGQALAKEFVKGYYGPAAPEMEKLLAFLDSATKKEKGSLAAKLPYQYEYLLDEKFHIAANEMLDKAERACAGNPVFLRHVEYERVPFDSALLYIWKSLEKKLGRAPAFDRAKIIARYAANQRTLVKTWSDNRKIAEQRLAVLDSEIKSLEVSAPLPKDFEGKDVVDFIWTDNFKGSGGTSEILDDPEAAGGRALRMNDQKDRIHKLPFTMGVYNNPAKRFALNFELKDIPKDEKYHLYKLGKYNFASGSVLWAHWSWAIQINIDKAWDPLSPYNERDVYASVKLTGPTYVPGSTRPDAVWIDRIIAVRP